MTTATKPIEKAIAGYDPDDAGRPLGSYAGLMSVFALGMVAAAGALRASGRELPERSRRRPRAGRRRDAQGQPPARQGQGDELLRARRSPAIRSRPATARSRRRRAAPALRYAVGELLVCPYCLAQWVAAGSRSASSPRRARPASSPASTSRDPLGLPAARLQGRRRPRLTHAGRRSATTRCSATAAPPRWSPATASSTGGRRRASTRRARSRALLDPDAGHWSVRPAGPLRRRRARYCPRHARAARRRCAPPAGRCA